MILMILILLITLVILYFKTDKLVDDLNISELTNEHLKSVVEIREESIIELEAKLKTEKDFVAQIGLNLARSAREKYDLETSGVFINKETGEIITLEDYVYVGEL